MKALLVTFLLLFHIVHSLSVAGIDIGSSVVTVARLKSGQPIHIVTNEYGKRNSPTMVAFDDKEYMVADRAASAFGRIPTHILSHLPIYLGRSAVASDEHSIPFPGPTVLSDPENGSLNITHEASAPFHPEEITAMLLKYIAKFTETQDCVITVCVTYFNPLTKSHHLLLQIQILCGFHPQVPPTFTQSQRQAMLDAAKLAQLNVIGLLDTNLAAPLWYGLERIRPLLLETPNATTDAPAAAAATGDRRCVVFADMGGIHTGLTLVGYDPIPAKKGKDKDKGHLAKMEDKDKGHLAKMEILAAELDDNLGGHHMDEAIVAHLVGLLHARVAPAETALLAPGEQCHPDVVARLGAEALPRCARLLGSPKTLARLWKDARKAKEVLTVNAEYKTTIESIEDVDLSFVLTRDQLQAMISPLLSRLSQHAAALRASPAFGQCPGPVAVQLLGGATRVPAVQEILSSVFGTELGKGVNPDEASAFGAAMYGALNSPGFSMRALQVMPRAAHNITVIVTKPDEASGSPGKAIKLFTHNSTLPSTKVVTLNRRADFVATLCYEPTEALPLGHPFDVDWRFRYREIPPCGPVIARVLVEGIGAMQAEYQNVTRTATKLTVTMSRDQLCSMTRGSLELTQTVTELVTRNVTVNETSANAKEPSSPTSTSDEPAATPSSDEPTSASAPEDPDTQQQPQQPEPTDEPAAGPADEHDDDSQAAPADSSPQDDDAAAGGGQKEPQADEAAAAAAAGAQAPEVRQVTETKTHTVPDPPRQGHLDPVAPPSLAGVPAAHLAWAQLEAGRHRLAEYDAREARKEKIAEAKNQLESTVYDLRSRIPDLEHFTEVTTEEERAALATDLEGLVGWLEEDPGMDTEEPYHSRLSALRQRADPLLLRHTELAARPQAAARLLGAINATLDATARLVNDSALNATEAMTIASECQDAQTWLTEQLQAQMALAPTADPVLTSAAIEEKEESLQRVVSLVSKQAMARLRAERAQREKEERAARKKAEEEARKEKERLEAEQRAAAAAAAANATANATDANATANANSTTTDTPPSAADSEKSNPETPQEGGNVGGDGEGAGQRQGREADEEKAKKEERAEKEKEKEEKAKGKQQTDEKKRKADEAKRKKDEEKRKKDEEKRKKDEERKKKDEAKRRKDDERKKKEEAAKRRKDEAKSVLACCAVLCCAYLMQPLLALPGRLCGACCLSLSVPLLGLSCVAVVCEAPLTSPTTLEMEQFHDGNSSGSSWSGGLDMFEGGYALAKRFPWVRLLPHPAGIGSFPPE
ncbi:putative Hypoxia up-regulated protein 1 [Paratrimastix pyriformis]|uniref:Hypoxia up-regulated protein 1 n=1 Tax=Paratrimastix pyriformis TaxID=342808 RepID=A0ABQ8UYX5_9EUKA|nr:putative Hypoxia up-regulated protein 1 [Paratrimastix pyriformis]